jgi:hypothetical protein
VTAVPAAGSAVAAPGTRGATGARQARLRPEVAERYPGIRAGEWMPAAVLADRVFAQTLLRPGGAAIRGRVLFDAHFEFRHGVSRGGERHGLRHRREG